MDNFITMINIQSTLLLYLLVGIYAKKRGIITKSNQQNFIDLVLQFLMPCMIFNSFQQNITLDKLQSAALILCISFGICLFSILLGKILYRKCAEDKKAILQYGTLINNAGFAGLPLAEGLYGTLGLFYASFSIIPNRIFMWSAGISLFTVASRRSRIKNVLLNPNIIAVFLGLIFSLAHLTLPSPLTQAITNMGKCVPSLSMIIVGAILADVSFKSLFDKDVFFLAFIRLLLIPLLALGVFKLCNLDPTIAGVSIILTSMPVGATTSLLAAKYNANVEFGSKCVCVTTILSLITVPFVTFFV